MRTKKRIDVTRYTLRLIPPEHRELSALADILGMGLADTLRFAVRDALRRHQEEELVGPVDELRSRIEYLITLTHSVEKGANAKIEAAIQNAYSAAACSRAMVNLSPKKAELELEIDRLGREGA